MIVTFGRAFQLQKNDSLWYEECRWLHFLLCTVPRCPRVQLTQRNHSLQLNTDVALFRDLNPSNYNAANGQAFCGFERISSNIESVPICPHIHGAVMIGAELKHNNLQFKVR
jgi:hypothetical protein